MELNKIKDELLKNVLIHQNQTYALYLKSNNESLEEYVGCNEFSCFRLASVTKQFIAYGIICLEKQGLINFNTTLKDIYSDGPNYFQQITILNLLNHTSGLPDYDEDLENEYSLEHQIHDEDILPYLYNVKELLFKPGSKYQYSNTAYILLGLIITKVSKLSLDDYMKNNVFDKLSLKNTFINHEGITNIPNRMYGHIIDNNQIIQKDQYWCSATIGDGGIYSCIHDMKKWINNLKEKEFNLLKETMFKGTIKTDEEDVLYGMGMRIINKDNLTVYTHSGFTIGTNTIMMFPKEKDFECIFLTNLGETNTDIIINNFLKIIK